MVCDSKKSLSLRSIALVGMLAAVANAAAQDDQGATQAGASPTSVSDPLCDSDPGTAAASGRPAMAKLMLLAEIERQARAGTMPMPCFVSDPTPEQLAQILSRFGARPPGEFLGMQNRFWTASNAWNANGGGLVAAGRASPAALTYSFIPDGTAWFDCNGGANQPSNLTAKFTTLFGAGSEDRGRELWRQAIAGWRRYSALTYSEVSDDGSGWTSSTAFPTGRGVVRIGGISETPSGGTSLGILACNNFPSSGADQSINTDYFTASAFNSSASNYRYFHNVVGHEHGHGLGAGHPVPCDHTKLMEPFINTNFDLLQIDDIRFAQRNYGDRFAGNNSAATATDFGDLTSPSVRSVIEPSLSTNGVSGVNGTSTDWFKFTLSSPQDVTITVNPTGGSYQAGTQSSGCTASQNPIPVDNAAAAGNVDLFLYDSSGTNLLNSSNNSAGIAEVVDRTAAGPIGQLPAGTYYVRVADVGPDDSVSQILQLYDLTIRVGTSKAPPKAIAGVNKRCAAGARCWFYGNINSYATEPGASIVTYQWDFDGDGTFDTSVANNSFVYVSNGVYNVKLQVIDNSLGAGLGLSATDTIQVTIFNATGLVSAVSPPQANVGTTVPITIVGQNFKGVTSLSQIALSGTGVTLTGNPVSNLLGTQITGLSATVAPDAPLGARNVTITNCDGLGGSATGNSVFAVVGVAPPNNDCSTPIDLGSATGSFAVDNSAATTGSVPAPAGCGGIVSNDIWYSWTAPSDGTLTANGTSGTFAPRLAVYNGTACPPSTALACGDLGALITLNVTSGQTVLFQFGSITPGTGGVGSIFIGFSGVPVACCFPDGSCTDLAANTCASQGGNPQSASSVCSTTECPQPPVGCCFSNGDCHLLSGADCVLQGGSAQGAGSGCVPNICPQPNGLCCAGATCQANVAPGQCTGPNRAFLTGSECNASGNQVGPCCKADFNHAGGITVQDIFDFLSAWFAGNPIANITGNGQGPPSVQSIFDFLSTWFAKGC